MKTKDWPVIKEAKKMAEHQLKFYDEMQSRYKAEQVHKQMLPIYFAFDPTHTCPICELKT